VCRSSCGCMPSTPTASTASVNADLGPQLATLRAAEHELVP
jgi:hypothetical protein